MSELDQNKIDRVVSAIVSGSDLETACAYAELSTGLMFIWLERGRREADRIANGVAENEEETQYLNLWNSLKKARAEAVVRNVAFVQKAAQDGTWQAAAWWLERTVPETFGKNANKPVEAPTPKPLES